MSLIEKISALEKEMNEVLNNGRKDVHAELFKLIDEGVFQKFPDVESVGWTQYTPYFNDGEPCHFGINTDVYGIYVNDECGYDLGDEEWAKHEDVREYVSDIIDKLSPRILETLYEEGLVVIKRDGTFEVKDYDHD